MRMITSFSGDNAFLSNFYLSPIVIKGDRYPSVEHAYQAAKTKDMNKRRMIRMASTPGKAKRLGRSFPLRDDWEDVKYDIMLFLVIQKFQQNPDLKELLVGTLDVVIVEGNYWHDNEWGNCYCDKCSGILGKNLLGEILMYTRERMATCST